jgi:hypothetical protein
LLQSGERERKGATGLAQQWQFTVNIENRNMPILGFGFGKAYFGSIPVCFKTLAYFIRKFLKAQTNTHETGWKMKGVSFSKKV